MSWGPVLRASAPGILFVLLLTAALPGTACAAAHAPKAEQAAPAEKVFNAEQFTLKNGMEVVVIPNHRVPAVTHMVWYKGGAADEMRGVSGIAHFLEHLMFKGSATMKPGEFSRRVRAMGGNDNAFTSWDYTAFHETVATDYLETVMRMEAERMAALAPPEAEVASERQVIIEERRQTLENHDDKRYAEELRAALYPAHPYGVPIIGWKAEMEKLDWADGKAFRERFYAPNNAILVVSGDVTGAQVRDMAERIYGGIPARPVEARDWPVVPPFTGDVTVDFTQKVPTDPGIDILTLAPSFHQNKSEALALQVLADILDGGEAARFHDSLVVRQKLAISADFYYEGDRLADGMIWASATPAPGVPLDQVRAALEAELARVVRDGVTDQEIREAKDRLKMAAEYARDSLTGPAMILGMALATGSTLDDIEYWPREIEAVTKAQVEAVARLYLSPERRQVFGYFRSPQGGTK